jgi:magnesium transporter
MTATEETTPPWEALRELIEVGSVDPLIAFIDGLPPADRGLVVSRLGEEQRRALLVLIDPDRAADLLAPLPYSQTIESLELLPAEQAARIIEELPSAEQADVLTELDDVRAEAILSEMEPKEADELRALCNYADDVAGGLMITEFFRVPSSSTVGQVVDDLHENAERYRDFDVQYAYVVDELERLEGVLLLRDLLFSRRSKRIDEIMIRSPHAVPDSATLPELSSFFDEHRLYGVPVVDVGGRLLGVVRRAALEAAQAEASEETYRSALGIVGGEELRSMPLHVRARRRLSWLTLNVVLNVAAASIIALHQDTLEAAIALAIFLPIISDMSGCSGSQAVAVTIRELALGLVRPFEVGRVLAKEISIGLINGAALGLLIALVAWLYRGDPWLSLVVGSALAVNTVVAVSIGGAVPLVLRRFGFDPALASGPILTTITDMCGFLLTLTFADAALTRFAA